MKTDFYESSVNGSIIGQVFVDVCQKLWPQGIQYGRVLFVVTDAAAYMKACSASQKLLFQNTHHITCLAHAMHNVCKEVRDG